MSVLLADIVTFGALLAMAFAFARLLRAPTPADRVIALDVVFAAGIALAAAVALRGGRVLFLEVAIGVAAVGFVAALVWARLIDKAAKEPDA